MKQNQDLMAMDAQRMTSLEIAAVTGKPHGDVLKAIRKMEADTGILAHQNGVLVCGYEV